MKKLAPYMFCVLGIGIGFLIGYAWVLRMHTFVTWHQSSSATTIQANLAVATLRSIRSGDTQKAIKRMEGILDNAILSLADIYKDCPRPQDATSIVRALTRAKEYRIEHPRKTESKLIDETVAEVFILADEAKENLPELERGYDESTNANRHY